MEPTVFGVEVVTDEAGSNVVRWAAVGGGSLVIATGPTPDPSEHVHAMTVPVSDGSAPLSAVPAGRLYVSITNGGATIVAAERRIRFSGSGNFRDLGGYPTRLGGATRWGQVFRSDNLHRLTAGDLVAFDALGIGVIYDLRRDDERAEEPGPREFVGLPLPSRRVSDAAKRVLTDRKAGEQWLFEDYCGMLADAGPVFGRIFSDLAEGYAPPSVFHCAGGKDRTGMTAALLLSWLGVERETVLDDYELTGVFNSGERLRAIEDIFVEAGIARLTAQGLLSAPRWAMADALTIVDDQYGGIETYLRGPANMTTTALENLRTRLVA
jgi:protein-tyrosine phosphatase